LRNEATSMDDYVQELAIHSPYAQERGR
jgi:hypothetical protein